MHCSRVLHGTSDCEKDRIRDFGGGPMVKFKICLVMDFISLS